MLEFSVKIDPSLEKVAINAIKDVLKKLTQVRFLCKIVGLVKAMKMILKSF